MHHELLLCTKKNYGKEDEAAVVMGPDSKGDALSVIDTKRHDSKSDALSVIDMKRHNSRG